MTRTGSEPQRTDLVLLIAYPYPPCQEPGATRPSHFAKYLRRFGYNVKVVTGFEDPSRDEVIFVPNRQRKPNRRTARGLSEMVLRKFFFPSDEGMLWAMDAARAAEPLVRQHRRTAVFSTFPPLNSHLAAWLLKRRFGVRWVADFRDPMVGSPGRQLTNSQLPYGALPTLVDRVIQRGMFRDADALIANTDTVLERWRSEYPAAAGKLTHIANGFDPEEMMTATPIPKRQRRVMAHVGSIYTGRHPVPLLHAMDRLIQNGRLDPNGFLLNLIGPVDWNLVPDHAVFERMRGIGCVEATGKVLPQAEARQAMREADYLLLLDVVVPGAGQQLPSKIFEYIPIGRPVLAITTRNSPSDRVLAGSGIPHACLYPDAGSDEADSAVLHVLESSSEPARPSEWFLQTYDAVHRTRALARLLDEST
jgi:glycosyltransferase involved in cell wall biosynthesis